MKKSLWVDVTDEQPEVECLAVSKQGEVMVGHVKWDKTEGCYSCESDGEIMFDITHWMTIPELPEMN